MRRSNARRIARARSYIAIAYDAKASFRVSRRFSRRAGMVCQQSPNLRKLGSRPTGAIISFQLESESAAQHAMFTGIIENSGAIESLSVHNDGGRVTIHAPNVAPSLAIANSIAVNGCCLTVVALDQERFSADLSGETVSKTSFGSGSPGLKVGSRVNL